MYLCCVESLSLFRLQFFKLRPFLKISQFLKNTLYYSPCFFPKNGTEITKNFLLHFLIHIDVLMLCRKFEPISSSNFRVMTIFKNRPISEKYPVLFFKKWLQNHQKFLLHFLIHIDVVMLCRKFEPISSSNFRVMTIVKNQPFFEKYPVL